MSNSYTKPFHLILPERQKAIQIGLALFAICILGSSLFGCENADESDLQQPTLTVVSPADNDIVPLESQVRIQFSATDNDELALWVINVNNKTIGNSVWADSENLTGNSVSVTRDFTTTSSGATEYEVVISVIEAAQNEAIEKRTFFAQP